VTRPVLLVGSVPLADAEAVFRSAAAMLGPLLRRIPDGETGARTHWVRSVKDAFYDHPDLEPAETEGPQHRLPPVRIRAGVDRAAIAFGEPGYARWALESWRTFDRLQRAGAIAPQARFQVSLPTPLAPISGYVVAADMAALEPPWEAGLVRELDRILAGIPHHRLAIQWDVAKEILMLEGVFPAHFAPLMPGIVERLRRLGELVPERVELGYHLCYGDHKHRHEKEPEDTGLLTEVMNRLAAGVRRRIDWIHLPVPRGRDDEAYFRPLAEARLDPGTELYLGLVHLTDGVAGARRRIAAASRFAPAFGIACECGMGRRPPETIPELLGLHAACAALP